ncbi:DUF4232 domain-containing protein (plasmid) [Rathayibacter festucae]|uniref:DUF4232 domain-containing protein n=1 Tax=Rathayibacter festucae TaxID=110937 RepID=A0ABX6H5H6_9MICO|nr:DUF4232 domain-containing protein [Rathayibacter festucae]QHC65077.1 DUF4232 domain-containing protein [Rathayibacter festucae]
MLIHRARPALGTGAALVLVLTGCAGAGGTAETSAGADSSPAASAATTTPAATAAGPSPSPSQTPAAVATACQDAITVRLEAEIGSGRSGYFVLTNSGQQPCALVGYLEPAAINSAGTVVTTVDHSDLNDVEDVPLELAPGASAYSWVFWDDSPDTIASCDQRADAEALEVTIPGGSTAKRIETGALPLCEGRGSILHIGPIDSKQRYASKGY